MTDTATRAGAALIGLGMVSKVYAQALQDLAGSVVLRGVYARTPTSRQTFLQANRAWAPGCRDYPSLDAVCADAGIDFVIITTPPNARLELIERLAAAGKHLLVEKPLERSVAAAEQLCAVSERAGVTLGVMLQHRARTGARELARRVQSGELGALGVAEIAVPWWREQAYYDEPGRGTYARDGGGVLISQAIHTLDLALSLTGPVSEVRALAATSRFHHMESEDFVSAGLRFADGAVGSLLASTACFPGSAEHIRLHFERASAELRASELTLHWRDGHSETVGEDAATGAGADPMAFPFAWHRDVIADFAAALRAGREPLVGGRQALAVQRLIEALAESAAAGRAVNLDPVNE